MTIWQVRKRHRKSYIPLLVYDLSCVYCHMMFFAHEFEEHLHTSHKDILIDSYHPWHDPESLFCDTTFLKELIGKDPTKGDECKG